MDKNFKLTTKSGREYNILAENSAQAMKFFKRVHPGTPVRKVVLDED